VSRSSPTAALTGPMYSCAEISMYAPITIPVASTTESFALDAGVIRGVTSRTSHTVVTPHDGNHDSCEARALESGHHSEHHNIAALTGPMYSCAEISMYAPITIPVASTTESFALDAGVIRGVTSRTSHTVVTPHDCNHDSCEARALESGHHSEHHNIERLIAMNQHDKSITNETSKAWRHGQRPVQINILAYQCLAAGRHLRVKVGYVRTTIRH
jgi:hypothetical protein